MYNGVPCDEWSGPTTGSGGGYGQLGTPIHGTRYAHRAAWIEANGPIPPETPYVLHHCDNRICREPLHLFLGTKGDNANDMVAKGRQWQQAKTCCPRGHPYDVVRGNQRRCHQCWGDALSPPEVRSA